MKKPPEVTGEQTELERDWKGMPRVQAGGHTVWPLRLPSFSQQCGARGKELAPEGAASPGRCQVNIRASEN